MGINWTALAIIVSGAAISASIALPERGKRDALHTLQGICWSTDIQSQAKDLANRTMRDQFKTWMKHDDPRWTDEELDKMTRIDLRDFHLQKVDLQSMHAACGASVDFSMTKADGSRLSSSGHILDFDVYAYSAKDWGVSMASAATLRAAVESLKPERGAARTEK